MVEVNRIKKIRYKGKTKIVWEVDRDDGGTDEFSINCCDQPTPGFLEKIQDLARHVCEICRFQKGYEKGLVVQGISITYEEKGMGVCITALKALPDLDSPLVINTPYCIEEKWSTAMADAIIYVCSAAEAYLNGERAQMELAVTSEGKS